MEFMRHGPGFDGEAKGVSLPGVIASRAWFQLWVAALYVVVEGWRQLVLQDEEADRLLGREPASLHQQFRHSTFHFDPQFAAVPFNFTGPDGLAWAEKLTEALSTFSSHVAVRTRALLRVA